MLTGPSHGFVYKLRVSVSIIVGVNSRVIIRVSRRNRVTIRGSVLALGIGLPLGLVLALPLVLRVGLPLV